jgi:hypothetical protein
MVKRHFRMILILRWFIYNSISIKNNFICVNLEKYLAKLMKFIMILFLSLFLLKVDNCSGAFFSFTKI